MASAESSIDCLSLMPVILKVKISTFLPSGSSAGVWSSGGLTPCNQNKKLGSGVAQRLWHNKLRLKKNILQIWKYFFKIFFRNWNYLQGFRLAFIMSGPFRAILFICRGPCFSPLKFRSILIASGLHLKCHDYWKILNLTILKFIISFYLQYIDH